MLMVYTVNCHHTGSLIILKQRFKETFNVFVLEIIVSQQKIKNRFEIIDKHYKIKCSGENMFLKELSSHPVRIGNCFLTRC